jgi:hypothetical protein
VRTSSREARIATAVVRWGRLFAVVLAISCGADGIDGVVNIGIIEYSGMSEGVLDAPDSVQLEKPVTVLVATYGSGCESADHMDVETESDVVTFTPYDFTRDGDCTLPLLRFFHEAEITFDTTGPMTLRVRGRRVNQQVDELTQITATIMVE